MITLLHIVSTVNTSQFPVTAIREIKLLKMLSHINILRLVEMAVERPPRMEVSTILSFNSLAYTILT